MMKLHLSSPFAFFALAASFPSSTFALPRVLSSALHHEIDSTTVLETRAEGDANALGPIRSVKLVLHEAEEPEVANLGHARFMAHAQLVFSRTARDPEMSIQISRLQDGLDWALIAIDHLDFNKDSRFPTLHRPFDFPGTPLQSMKAIPIGQYTALTNEEILSPTTGDGIATRVWGKDPYIQWGNGRSQGLGQSWPGDYHGPLSFVGDFLRHPSVMGPDWALDNLRASIELRKGIAILKSQAYLESHDVSDIYVIDDSEVRLFENRYPEAPALRGTGRLGSPTTARR